MGPCIAEEVLRAGEDHFCHFPELNEGDQVEILSRMSKGQVQEFPVQLYKNYKIRT